MKSPKRIILVGIPCQAGSAIRGCVMGPDALRTAGLRESLAELGHEVRDIGNLSPTTTTAAPHPRFETARLEEAAGWIAAASETARKLSANNSFPLFMGGDRTATAGAIAGIAHASAAKGKPLFLLWLAAHSGFCSLETARPEMLRDTYLAYLTGQSGFDGHFPALETTLTHANICLFGVRGSDREERKRLLSAGLVVNDGYEIEAYGLAPLLQGFLANVAAAGGNLHVSLDLGLLGSEFAPAVNTRLPGGFNPSEVRQIMDILDSSQLVTSLDIVELNPFLDERGRTANMTVDLTAALLGGSVPNRSAAIA